LIAKANEVWRELPGRLTGVRILTDVRPIFADGETLVPASSFIVHTLRLEVQDGDESRKLHLTLDAQAISALEAALGRARVKELSLEAALRETAMPASRRDSRD
jgi:hypothetical protein